MTRSNHSGRDRSRRAFLTAAGATLGSGVLGGCLSGTPLGSSKRTVAVGPGHRLEFQPESVTVKSGTTVRWEFRSDDHNVVPALIPEASDWEGTPGRASITYGEGYTYETTFTISGIYTYYCQPHIDAGMTGRVVVE